MSMQFVYQVIAPGFWNGGMYAPNTDRDQIVTDKELKPCPSWLKLSSKVAGKTAARIIGKQKDAADKKKEQISQQNVELGQPGAKAPDFSGAAKPGSNVVTL